MGILRQQLPLDLSTSSPLWTHYRGKMQSVSLRVLPVHSHQCFSTLLLILFLTFQHFLHQLSHICVRYHLDNNSLILIILIVTAFLTELSLTHELKLLFIQKPCSVLTLTLSLIFNTWVLCLVLLPSAQKCNIWQSKFVLVYIIYLNTNLSKDLFSLMGIDDVLIILSFRVFNSKAKLKSRI